MLRRPPAPPQTPASRQTDPRRRRRQPGKQDLLITLAGQRHDLTAVPLKSVSGIANAISAEIGLSPGTGRRVLLGHVRSLQNGQPSQTPGQEDFCVPS